MKFSWFIWLVIAAGLTVGAAEVKLPAREKFRLVLLTGQSNMAGRGEVAPADRKPHPRVLMLDRSGQWVPAVDPVHYDKPAAGVGPGRTFAIALAESDPDIVVGLIPTACGGAPISVWEPGAYWEQTASHPYDDMLSRARRALRDGELAAILFHQGEGDCYGNSPELYQKRLFTFIKRMRSDLNAVEVPVIIGQLSRFPGENWSAGKSRVDAAHRAAAAELPLVGFAESEGFTSNPDRIHFDAASQREFGRRYFEAYRKLLTKQSD